jgi:hypothetical protein
LPGTDSSAPTEVAEDGLDPADHVQAGFRDGPAGVRACGFGLALVFAADLRRAFTLPDGLEP